MAWPTQSLPKVSQLPCSSTTPSTPPSPNCARLSSRRTIGRSLHRSLQSRRSNSLTKTVFSYTVGTIFLTLHSLLGSRFWSTVRTCRSRVTPWAPTLTAPSTPSRRPSFALTWSARLSSPSWTATSMMSRVLHQARSRFLRTKLSRFIRLWNSTNGLLKNSEQNHFDNLYSA